MFDGVTGENFQELTKDGTFQLKAATQINRNKSVSE